MSYSSKILEMADKFAQRSDRTTLILPPPPVGESRKVEPIEPPEVDEEPPETAEVPSYPEDRPTMLSPAPEDPESTYDLPPVEMPTADVLDALGKGLVDSFLANQMDGSMNEYVYYVIEGLPLGHYRVTQMPKGALPMVEKIPYKVQNVEYNLDDILSWAKKKDLDAWLRAQKVMRSY